jgi:alanine dehydrogenase
MVALAERGIHAAAAEDPGLKKGVNVAGGHVTYPSVAEAVALPYVSVDDALTGVPAL